MTATNTPYSEMQKAVDIVNLSLHQTNKVAATLFCKDFSLSRTNYWPEIIVNHFGHTTDIGNSSGTIHAEVACILASPASTEGTSVCVTDPFCPNCAKNIAEAGIKTIYIDHKGFDKDFAARRGDHFQNMSMQICARAGISIYEIRRKEERIVPILEIPSTYTPANDAPVIVTTLTAATQADFRDIIADSKANIPHERFAVALAFSAQGKIFGLCAKSHLAIGYSRNIDVPEMHTPSGKYSFTLEPVNRLLMNAARMGLKIHAEYVYASSVPTSRELVNMVGAGINTFYIDDKKNARDADSLHALNQLQQHGILSVISL